MTNSSDTFIQRFLICRDNARESASDLYDLIIDQLGLLDTGFIVEFMGKSFDFSLPITEQEKVENDKMKHKLAVMLMKDAYKKLMKDIDKKRSSGNWIANVARFNRTTPQEESTSQIVSGESYEIDEGSSKDLDYDSIYIKAQRKGLSDEEKWNILLADVVIREGRESLQRDSSDQLNS